MDILVKMVFGSHLYGLNTPESDRDYKGVYVPEVHSLLHSQPKKSIRETTKQDMRSKSTFEDEETEILSLQYYAQLLSEGNTFALDMIHARPEHLIINTSGWELLQTNRRIFYSKKMAAFVSYSVHQAAKYGLKGGRLHAARSFLNLLDTLDPEAKLGVYEDKLKKFQTEESTEEIPIVFSDDGIRSLIMNGRSYQFTAPIWQVKTSVLSFVESYGTRAIQAENNENVDWKAVSHAFRACYQVHHLLVDGDYEYPLPETEFLLKIKQGEVDYRDIAPELESLISITNNELKNSVLPDHPDMLGIHRLIEQIYRDRILSYAKELEA